jgi:hypothetical protein
MTDERIKGIITFHCDSYDCHNYFEAKEAQDFIEAARDLRYAGWQLKFINKEWFHYCPECKS